MNHSRLILLVALAGLVASGVTAGEIDKIDKKLAREAPLFERAKMRGRLRDDVSLDVVKQTPGDGYQLRVVEWWPKKGVDLIAEPKGEPRTWTISQEKPEQGKDARWWPETLRGKKQFKAHLLGFRGIGAAQNPWQDDVTKPLTPAVVLRLPDGRKRCFGRGSFSDEDEKYITDLYEKQMKVLRDNTFEEGFERVAASHDMSEELSGNPLYTPGTTHISSKHFTATLGSEPPDNGRSKWLNATDKEGAALNRKLIMRGWEDWWSYLEHGGHLMFFSEKLGPKYKYRFLVGGTKKDGKTLGGGFGGGYGACSGGNGNWWGMYHEWGHGIPSGNKMVLGGGEALADSGQLIGDPTESIHKCYFQIMKPWKNLFHGWYPAAYTWNIIGDDPNWGYALPYAITRMMSEAESTPMHVLARVGEKRGLFKNGIRGVGDLLGQVGARMAEFDNELQSSLRRSFAMPTRVRLLEVDRKENRYRSNPASAPEAFGVNIIRLVPDANAKELTVDFQGHYDPKIYSDWRVCIVSVDKDGRCRYSPLWNKGKMSMKPRPGDSRYWLTVTAAPTALSPTTGPERYQKAHVVYQGGFGYRYPYDVVLRGCRAGSPHSTPLDDETCGQGGLKAGRRHGMGMNVASIPVTDPDEREHVEAVLKAQGGENAQWHLNNMKGKRHPNGGGWVADTATVDESAYVGPNAMVLDQAQVLDNAVIEDYVIVYGDAVFRDNARAYGKLPVKQGVFSKDARLYRRPDLVSDMKKPKTPGYLNVDAPQKRYAQLIIAPPIQANYDMFHPEATLLEDHFNERSGSIFGAHIGDRLFFDGVLIGNPGFTYDGVETGAVTFNGKDQWAEMPGEMADLEVVTVDVRFKVESTKQQTVWMFGNDASSHVSLSVAGGKLALLGRGGGKQADCRGGKVVPGQWTTVRAELDGVTMKLFQDGKNIVEVETAFRASDAFTPGKVRMATLAAGLGGATPMAGAVDYLRLFTEVLADFENVEIPLINPRRLCPRTLARFDAKFPSSAAKQLHFRERVVPNHPLSEYYQKYAVGLNTRLEDLARMNGDVKALEDKLESLAERRQKTYEESRDAKKNDQAYQERFKESGQKLEALRQKRNATLFLHPGYKESYDKREVMSATRRKRAEEVQAELKKTPAYTALLERIKTTQKKVESMRREKNQDWQKENKKLHELHGQRAKMVAAKMGPEADELLREIHRYGHTVEAQRALARQTPDYMEIDKQYRELEEKLRYVPDPKFVQERKQIDETIEKTKRELETLKKVAAAEANPNEAYIVDHSRHWAGKMNAMVQNTILMGLLPKPYDHAPHLEAARKLQSRPWPTTVDWDGRAEYEKNKDAIAQPIMQHYLKRMKPWMYE
jgi:hypothetical protein